MLRDLQQFEDPQHYVLCQAVALHAWLVELASRCRNVGQANLGPVDFSQPSLEQSHSLSRTSSLNPLALICATRKSALTGAGGSMLLIIEPS